VVSASKAQVWPPAEMAVTEFRPNTVTGNDLEVLLLSPSLPESLAPQQRTVVSASKAQVWLDPEEIAVTEDSPETVTGNDLEVVLPSPS
jgi:hypothetical protein